MSKWGTGTLKGEFKGQISFSAEKMRGREKEQRKKE